MKNNQKLRTLLRSSATKSIREIDAELEKESPSRETIGIKFRVLETIENQLRDANVQVMNLILEDEAISPHDLEKEQDMVVQYEENFVRTELRVTENLQFKENGQQGRGTLDPARSAQEGMSSCKLPKMAFPVYDGTCLEWLGWWSRFEMIHESAVLSEVEKFHYLVQSMKAGTRADQLVRSYPLIPENYPKVVKALKDRFGDSNILTEVYVRQLLKLVINNYVRPIGVTFEILGVIRGDCPANACFLYPIVESSLPEDLLRIWQRSALAGYGGDELELPITIDQRLERLLEFIGREVKREQRLEYMKEGFGESSQRSNYGQHIARIHAAQIKEAQGRVTSLCLSCKGKHWIQDCAGWRSMTVTKRMDEMRKVNACFRCLRVGHVIATCRTQIRCSHCKGPHHTTLHLPRRVSMEDRDQRERQNTEEPRVSPGEQEIALSGMHTLPLADPQFETSGRVDVILRADVYGSLLLPEVEYDEETQLCAQKTRLGWIISGKLPGEGEVGPHRVYNIRVNYEVNLDNVLRRFWEVEEVPLRHAKSDADESEKSQVEKKSVVKESEKSQVEKKSVVEESEKSQVEKRSVVEESEKSQVEKISVVETEESHKTEVEKNAVVDTEEGEKAEVEKQSVEADESEKAEVEKSLLKLKKVKSSS
ncbi:hypothetical protein LAZ67_9000193 [Cordylochernes scorpioides]|uniref:Gag-like protein n=1 Tax=Cordylochernes scorpioides TaxID=51811 RepID=A0ABY6KTY8_9ARAC|nr:hypothetical protein LAZ67_9000193 [Cordylochernes scorpioides]